MKIALAVSITFFLVCVSCARTVNLNRVKGIKGPGAPIVTPSGVLFSLDAPDARIVTVAGNFNGWDSQANPLERHVNGLWSVTIPLKAGQKYYYKFYMDGYEIADPDNPDFEPDGGGGSRSIVMVQ